MVLIFHFNCTLKCHLQFVSIWIDRFEILPSGKGLKFVTVLIKKKKPWFLHDVCSTSFPTVYCTCLENFLTKMAESFFKWVGNTVGREFLPFLQCFQKTSHTADMQEQGLVWEMVNIFGSTCIENSVAEGLSCCLRCNYSCSECVFLGFPLPFSTMF